jgi:hypothetical protein
MNTHSSTGGNRRLALLALYASLCSVFALQLAMFSSQATDALNGSIVRISALMGDHGIKPENLRVAPLWDKMQSRKVSRLKLHGAPATRVHQVRTGR